jgi:hypothetical protein
MHIGKARGGPHTRQRMRTRNTWLANQCTCWQFEKCVENSSSRVRAISSSHSQDSVVFQAVIGQTLVRDRAHRLVDSVFHTFHLWRVTSPSAPLSLAMATEQNHDAESQPPATLFTPEQTAWLRETFGSSGQRNTETHTDETVTGVRQDERRGDPPDAGKRPCMDVGVR